jgi:hypothetical protein
LTFLGAWGCLAQEKEAELETGHPDGGDRLWTWCFRASFYTLYRIRPSRGAGVQHWV